jgi:hypothetical protein
MSDPENAGQNRNRIENKSFDNVAMFTYQPLLHREIRED